VGTPKYLYLYIPLSFLLYPLIANIPVFTEKIILSLIGKPLFRKKTMQISVF